MVAVGGEAGAILAEVELGMGLALGQISDAVGTEGIEPGTTTSTMRPVKHIPPLLQDHSTHECTTEAVILR